MFGINVLNPIISVSKEDCCNRCCSIYIVFIISIVNNWKYYSRMLSSLSRSSSLLSTRKIKRNICLTIHKQISSNCDFHLRPFAFFFYTRFLSPSWYQNFSCQASISTGIFYRLENIPRPHSSIIFSFSRSCISFFIIITFIVLRFSYIFNNIPVKNSVLIIDQSF